MKKRVRLTGNQQVDIINAYSVDLVPMITLADRYGVTRQAIYKVLARSGIDTRKQQIPVSCTTCGQEILRVKSRIRKQLHHFCGDDCYSAFLDAGNGKPYIQSRHGQRIARTIVSSYFALQEKNIVHHDDRNTFNNDINNLRVFTNQGDHIRYHRGFDVEPIWDGRYL